MSCPPQASRATPATAFASLKARKRQRIGRLYVSAAMREPGTLSATGTVNVPNTARAYRFKTANARAVPGVLVRLRLKLSKEGLRGARKHLRRHRTLRARAPASRQGAGRGTRTVRSGR